MAENPEELVGGIDPNAFDAQMLLLDAYLKNIPGLDIKAGPTVGGRSEENVPYLPAGFDSVNALMGLSRDGVIYSINDFISNLTPLEAAKVYPQIKLQIVDHNTDKVFDVPIGPVGSTGVSGVTRSRTFRRTQGQSHYYVRNEVGLNSLSLELDGRDLPFFGKSYIVKMKLTFDSINTFTSPIYGTFGALGYPVTFAQVFRSSGIVGVERFYTRLSISYSSNDQEIIDKYALNMPQMRFNLMMDLTETKFAVEENLKVVIDTSYQSRSESLFNSNLIFDFLGLDLRDAEEAKRRDMDTAEEAMKILDESKKEYVKTAQEAVLNNKSYRTLSDKYKGIESKEDFEKERGRNGRAYQYGDWNDAEFDKFSKARESVSQKKLEEKFEEFSNVQSLREQATARKKSAIQALANLRHSQLTKALNETFDFNGAQPLAKGVVKTIRLDSKQIYDYYNQTRLTKQVKKDLTKEEQAQENKKPVVSTVEIKTKPKEGDKSDGAGAGGAVKNNINNYEKDLNSILIDLGQQKQIDYILFGDIMRLVYERLYKITSVQAKKLSAAGLADKDSIDKLKKSLEKTILLFSEISFESFEDAVKNPSSFTLREKNLFDVPISIKHLRYILAKKLYGKQQNHFTIFELMEELIQLISLTRRRKAQVLNNQTAVGNFTLKKMTYPMEFDFSSPVGSDKIFKINTDNTVPVEEIFNGMLVYVKRAKDNKPIKRSDEVCPRFIFGGAGTGIIKKFTISEIADSDLQKLVMEQLRGTNDQVIPSFFEVSIKSIMAPFFQLGMQIKVSAPTIDATASANANMFIAGDYNVSSVKHEFTAGTGFNTTIKATLYNSDKKSLLKSRGLETKEETKANESALKDYKKISGKISAERDVKDILKELPSSRNKVKYGSESGALGVGGKV